MDLDVTSTIFVAHRHVATRFWPHGPSNTVVRSVDPDEKLPDLNDLNLDGPEAKDPYLSRVSELPSSRARMFQCYIYTIVVAETIQVQQVFEATIELPKWPVEK